MKGQLKVTSPAEYMAELPEPRRAAPDLEPPRI